MNNSFLITDAISPSNYPGCTGAGPQHQGCILSLCLFNLYAEYIMRNARLDEAQAGIKILGKILITSVMQMIPPLWQKTKRK